MIGPPEGKFTLTMPDLTLEQAVEAIEEVFGAVNFINGDGRAMGDTPHPVHGSCALLRCWPSEKEATIKIQKD